MDYLDSQIAKAHSAAEATEHQARQLEARILKTGAQRPSGNTAARSVLRR